MQAFVVKAAVSDAILSATDLVKASCATDALVAKHALVVTKAAMMRACRNIDPEVAKRVGAFAIAKACHAARIAKDFDEGKIHREHGRFASLGGAGASARDQGLTAETADAERPRGDATAARGAGVATRDANKAGIAALRTGKPEDHASASVAHQRAAELHDKAGNVRQAAVHEAAASAHTDAAMGVKTPEGFDDPALGDKYSPAGRARMFEQAAHVANALLEDGHQLYNADRGHGLLITPDDNGHTKVGYLDRRPSTGDASGREDKSREKEAVQALSGAFSTLNARQFRGAAFDPSGKVREVPLTSPINPGGRGQAPTVARVEVPSVGAAPRSTSTAGASGRDAWMAGGPPRPTGGGPTSFRRDLLVAHRADLR